MTEKNLPSYNNSFSSNSWEQDSSHASIRSNLTKKESLRIQKQSYKVEKKKVHNELKNTIQDPTVVIRSDWLKIRSTLKNWSRIWCVLKPGVLILYKTQKLKQWIGTVLLTSSEIIQRPSKKEGFCFKIYHPLDQVIWTAKGPSGESMSLLTHSLPSNHLILRSTTQSDGQCWMDALELARKCSNLLKKAMPTLDSQNTLSVGDVSMKEIDSVMGDDPDSYDEGLELALLKRKPSKAHSEKSTDDGSQLDAGDQSSEDPSKSHGNHLTVGQNEALVTSGEETGSFSSRVSSDAESNKSSPKVPESEYVLEKTDMEMLGSAGEAAEDIASENKGLIWTILKQLRPGMDLSKVVLPTFILEPRSFLDKLSDYYFHADLLSKAARVDDPYERMKAVAKWYLSGFYKKPDGIKKPYNPIIGEIFRCKWQHPETESFTHYIAEQVSHHPPISAFAAVNKKDGFVVHGSILAKSKFYGNSLSAFLDGTVSLTLLHKREEYILTMPYAHCKGFLYGSMTMEFGGKVDITCQKTGYSTEIEYKLKPFFGGSDSSNRINGRILHGKKNLATIQGFWDREIYLTDLKRATTSIFWKPTPEIRAARLQRQVIAMNQQLPNESQKLWCHVTKAIEVGDQNEATKYKCILEENQRKGARERAKTDTLWLPKLFEYNPINENWTYKFLDKRPWDTVNDIVQYESDGCISTMTKNGVILRSPGKSRMIVDSENMIQSVKIMEESTNRSNDEALQVKLQADEDAKQTLLLLQEQQQHILLKLSQIQKSLEKHERSNQSYLFNNLYLIILVAIFAILAYYFK
uniref:oxysterol-binding protein-related protein 8-like n=1 Tax=Styela clava TaxID=7725 RepID=UPI00193A82C6|nr:oxysterol-binding protein-related protein 8-like [Styela clava]